MEPFTVLNLGYAKTVHHWVGRDISSPFARIFYVKSGRAILHIADKDVTLSGNHMYILPSYTPHSYECDPEVEFYYLFVYHPQFDGTSIFDIYDLPIEVNANDGSRLLFEHYCMLYPQLNLPTRDAEAFVNHRSYHDYIQEYMAMPLYERMQLHGMVEIILSYFIKHATTKALVQDERIARLVDYIQQNISKTITVEELADKACLTKSYLIRYFRQTMGITPLQYVIQKKIQHSQSLLLGTGKSVQHVAQAVGIDDVSYFIRLFRKNIGYTPQQYRQKLIG